jgi:hypothetical protein
MSWGARETDGTAHPPHPALVRACRCWLITWALVAATLGLALTGTTTASAANFTYDAPVTTRVDVRTSGGADSGSAQLTCMRDWSALPSVVPRGASTTPGARSVATEAEAGFPGIKPGAAGGETAGKAFPGSVRQAALEENPSTCVYCHMETDAPQVDHAIPRVQGGNATLENAQTTCGWCNASKGGRTFPVNPPPGYEGAWPPPWWNIFGP